MILNLVIFETVVEAAKAKAAGQAAWVRAIEKAFEQLVSNPYIAEKDGGLLILSYSGETYHANGACQCKAYASGRPCWHRAANQLVRRYREAEAAQVAAPAPPVETVVADERAQLIVEVQKAWHHARPFESIALKLHRLFGVMRLENVSTDDLHHILAALTPSKAAQAKTNSPRRASLLYTAPFDACARRVDSSSHRPHLLTVTPTTKTIRAGRA